MKVLPLILFALLAFFQNDLFAQSEALKPGDNWSKIVNINNCEQCTFVVTENLTADKTGFHHATADKVSTNQIIDNLDITVTYETRDSPTSIWRPVARDSFDGAIITFKKGSLPVVQTLFKVKTSDGKNSEKAPGLSDSEKKIARYFVDKCGIKITLVQKTGKNGSIEFTPFDPQSLIAQ